MPMLQRLLVLFAFAMSVFVPLAAGTSAVAAPFATFRATVLSVGGDTLRVQAGWRAITHPPGLH
jgi:hypothetical protein